MVKALQDGFPQRLNPSYKCLMETAARIELDELAGRRGSDLAFPKTT